MTLFGFLVIAAILVEGEANNIRVNKGRRLHADDNPLISPSFQVTHRGVVMTFNADNKYSLIINELEFNYNNDYAHCYILAGGVGQSFVKIRIDNVSQMLRVYASMNIYGEITGGSNEFNKQDYKWRYWNTKEPDKYYRPNETPEEKGIQLMLNFK